MAVGQDRRSRPVGAEPPAAGARGDGRPGPAAVDGLLARVARGDEEAFAAVCDQVGGAVYGVARRVLGDQARSEQVAGEVLVEVWRTASRFSPSAGSGLSWIMTIARRRAVDLVAHRGLASLPGPQREALFLACCGYTGRQAADLAGVPAGTVAERLHAGLLRLGSCPE